MATNAKKFMERMRAGDPELQAEYERLGPRYAAIDALIRARKRANLTQAGLAERMGVQRPVISRLESGEHSPRLDTLAAAADALDSRLTVKFVRGSRKSVAMAKRDTAKYQFKRSNGTIIRSGITSRPLKDRERELKRTVNQSGSIHQVGRRTTDQAARTWEKRQRKGTPPGGRR